MSDNDQMHRFWLAAIVESSDDAIMSLALDGVVTSWNRAAEQLYGYLAEEVIGRPASILAAPGREGEMAAILDRIRSGEKVDHYETQRRRKDGTIIDISLTVSPVRNAAGEIIGASKIARDIGERKRAQEERGLLAAIVDSSDDAIMSKDLNGIVTSWNRAAEQLYGYLAEEVIGKPISILAAPGREDEMVLILERIRRGEKVDHYETQRRRKDGTIVDISLTVSPVRNAAGEIIGASKIARDISERKRAEQHLRLITHELDHRAKNVLAVAQAILRLTRADDIKEYIAAVQDRIAALARAHTQVAENRWRGTPLESLVQAELKAFVTEQGKVRIDGPAIVLAPVSAQAISIVLHELATNAAKYGALSAPEGRVDVTWSRAEKGGDLRLRWIESNGPPVRKPDRQSYGTRVIARQIPGQLGGKAQIDWLAEGLRCEFLIPKRHLAPAQADREESATKPHWPA